MAIAPIIQYAEHAEHAEYYSNNSFPDLDSTTTDVLAGIFFGISAALLVIALPLALYNYCDGTGMERD
ncbi:hypothetical protein F4678DRAFT_460576 [Xylaria arbuscula]|nr:hypothetical protein F4678DRAFT_460576 [Xylaria arbuscula]